MPNLLVTPHWATQHRVDVHAGAREIKLPVVPVAYSTCCSSKVDVVPPSSSAFVCSDRVPPGNMFPRR